MMRIEGAHTLEEISELTGLAEGELWDIWRLHPVLCDCSLCGAVDRQHALEDADVVDSSKRADGAKAMEG